MPAALSNSHGLASSSQNRLKRRGHSALLGKHTHPMVERGKEGEGGEQDEQDTEQNGEQHAEEQAEEDDTSGDNWSGIKWVKFVVSDKCQRWPAAVLSEGQMIYIGQHPAVEVCDFSIWPEEFVGTKEDIRRATGGEDLREHMNLKRAIDEATAWVRKNSDKN